MVITRALRQHKHNTGSQAEPLCWEELRAGAAPAAEESNAKTRQKPRLHENPVPGVGVILKDLHSNLIGAEQVGDASEGRTREHN